MDFLQFNRTTWLLCLEQNAFDNICHEHREYYSLTSLKPLLEKYGLEIFKVALNGINGGEHKNTNKIQRL